MIVIRLKQTGMKNHRQWRVVVIDNRLPWNGRLIEEIGSYNPLVDPPEVRIRRDRYEAWVKKGARPSETVFTLIKKAGKAA